MPAKRAALASRPQGRSSAEVEWLPNVFLLVSDRGDSSAALVEGLQCAAVVRVVRPDNLQADTEVYSRVIVDIDLADVGKVSQVRRKLETASLRDQPRDFFVGANMHHARTQAYALGATSVLMRPILTEAILLSIREQSARTFQDELDSCSEYLRVGMSAAHRILMQIFEGTRQSRGPSFADIAANEIHITRALHHANLQGWINIVQHHHNHTYRHCLMVTGVAVAFASYIGLAMTDQIRLARAAIMHDVGKAFTPIAILDKPGKLTDEEMMVMRRHSRDGYDYLAKQSGFPDEVLEVALHHHDLLDGTATPRASLVQPSPTLCA